VHKNAAALLRFDATEYCEEAVWYFNGWSFKANSANKHLRQTSTHRGYGSITVSVLYATDVANLHDGGLNHEISTFVTKKAAWPTPTIAMDGHQDQRFTMYVAHQTAKPVEITRSSHKRANFVIDYASQLNWKVEESIAAKIVFNYRSKGESWVAGIKNEY
jgi:hypothetical protein